MPPVWALFDVTERPVTVTFSMSLPEYPAKAPQCVAAAVVEMTASCSVRLRILPSLTYPNKPA